MATKSLATLMEEREARDTQLTELLQRTGVQVLAHNGSVKLSGLSIQKALVMEQGPFLQIWLQGELGLYSDMLVLIDPHNQHWLIEGEPTSIIAISKQALPLSDINLRMLQSEQETVKGRLSELNAILNFVSMLATPLKEGGDTQ